MLRPNFKKDHGIRKVNESKAIEAGSLHAVIRRRSGARHCASGVSGARGETDAWIVGINDEVRRNVVQRTKGVGFGVKLRAPGTATDVADDNVQVRFAQK